MLDLVPILPVLDVARGPGVDDVLSFWEECHVGVVLALGRNAVADRAEPLEPAPVRVHQVDAASPVDGAARERDQRAVRRPVGLVVGGALRIVGDPLFGRPVDVDRVDRRALMVVVEVTPEGNPAVLPVVGRLRRRDSESQCDGRSGEADRDGDRAA